MTRETILTATVPSGTRPLRIGIAGAGKMAQHHARSILRTPGAVLAAIADPSDEARKAMLAIAPDATAFQNVTEMLKGGRLDVVHVCTPPALHRPVAIAALEAGCNIYVEKPFAESVADTEAILGLAEARGLKVCAGHQLLFEPPTRIV